MKPGVESERKAPTHRQQRRCWKRLAQELEAVNELDLQQREPNSFGYAP